MPLHLHTRLTHSGRPAHTAGGGPVNVPVVRTSTVSFESMAALREQEVERKAGGAIGEGTRLGEMLVKSRVVTEEQVLLALGEQFDIPVLLELKPEDCDHDLAQRVPINFAKQHYVLPMRRRIQVVRLSRTTAAITTVPMMIWL